MPVKKDGSGKRWVELEFVAPGTPEQLWQAMATGPGNAAWFTRAQIDGRVGGVLRFEFAPGMTSQGEVTAWEPPHRFGYVEREWNGDAPPVATEIVITPRAGGRCVVRMVHTLFSSKDDWDDQLESFEEGWPSFFEVLRLYLARHAGRPAASFQATAHATDSIGAAWSRLASALGVAGVDVGQRLTTPPEPQRLSGVVEGVKQDARLRAVTLGLDAPQPGTAVIAACGTEGGGHLSVCLFFYGDRAAAAIADGEAKWRDWLSATAATGAG